MHTFWTFTLITTHCLLLAGSLPAAKCPCSDPSLCKTVTAKPKKETFVFRTAGSTWKNYDWSKITTVGVFGEYDPQLMCTAHAHGVRLVQAGAFPVLNLTDETQRDKWITEQVQLVEDRFMDGFNIDIEDSLFDSYRQELLTTFVNQTTQVFHSKIPGSQVTFDVAWTPDCARQGFRCYDYRGLADVTDFLFVMDYDEMGSIADPCVADANSPYNKTVTAMESFIDLGIPLSKLLMGLPWYGYDYPCLNLTRNKCVVKHLPFWPVCDENVGTKKNYAVIMKLLANNSTSGRIWSDVNKSPYFNYKDSTTEQFHQIWYDDPQSLKLKFDYATKRGLLGVGLWQADALDYSDDPTAKAQTKAMWDALPTRKNN
ncbi:di-N-acetylchitobiase-like [Ptychodera flava]|uniref:di-N-acetylchitobiase-like n=1 Tax=Ptychodera flava TaxID=63121 RepID=UPI00396A886E